jgi:hypothetical protein
MGSERTGTSLLLGGRTHAARVLHDVKMVKRDIACDMGGERQREGIGLR